VAESDNGPGYLAERLEHLFQTVHPGQKKPFSNPEVARFINEAAGEQVISQAYLWQLRKGIKRNPTLQHIAALAAFFGETPMYFFDTSDGAAPDPLREQVRTVLDEDKVRTIALRAIGLSEETLQAIQALIDRARELEGLPPA
jgi:transcriptional regulator with XRE-family HTH domain